MFENLKKFYQQESWSKRSERMIPAAIYGALVATIYTLTLSFVNVYTFPNLPLGVDWVQLLGTWLGYSVLFAVCGTIVGWFTEEYEGIVGGGIVITVLLMMIYLISSDVRNGITTAQAIFTALPLIGVDMLAAWGLRWTARIHLEIKHKEKPELRQKRWTRHVLTIILVGLVPGILGRMDAPVVRTLSQFHELLQTAPNDPSVLPRLPLRQVPELQNHFGMAYTFYTHQSTRTVGTLDVTIRFKDGYAITCSLPVSGGTSFITQCNEGDVRK